MVFSTGPDGRKRVDLSALPAWSRLVLAVAVVLLVGGLALLFGHPSGGATVPVAAVVVAVITFAAIAWWAQHPR